MFIFWILLITEKSISIRLHPQLITYDNYIRFVNLLINFYEFRSPLITVQKSITKVATIKNTKNSKILNTKLIESPIGEIPKTSTTTKAVRKGINERKDIRNKNPGNPFCPIIISLSKIEFLSFFI